MRLKPLTSTVHYRACKQPLYRFTRSVSTRDVSPARFHDNTIPFYVEGITQEVSSCRFYADTLLCTDGRSVGCWRMKRSFTQQEIFWSGSPCWFPGTRWRARYMSRHPFASCPPLISTVLYWRKADRYTYTLLANTPADSSTYFLTLHHQ